MPQSAHTIDERSTETAWSLVLAAAQAAQGLAENETAGTAFRLDASGRLERIAREHPDAVLVWHPRDGWQPCVPPGDADRALLDLYLPICSALRTRPITVGHLGLSLDGFIATRSGDSQFVTGQQNIVHLHRMRALCDAVVVGAGTVAADDPQLTTRHVQGPTPLRVVFDPGRRLGVEYRLFNDEGPPTLYACARALVRQGERSFGRAAIVGLDSGPAHVEVTELMRVLRERGCTRIFVEGGGVTVSAFLEANLLDRLHMAIAPLIIGDGRPAIRLPARATLQDCRRPQYRVFRMGGDILFDCNLSTGNGADADAPYDACGISRVI